MRKFLQLTLSLLLMFVANSANAWKFTVNSPAEGNVAELYQIVLDEPAGTMWVDEFSAMPCTLKCSDGTEYTYNMSDDFQSHVAGTPLNSAEIVAPGTYTLTIPANTFHINGVGNEEQTFTWTIGGGDNGNGGSEDQKSPYTLTYDKSAEFLKLTKEGCTSYEATYMGGATLEGYDGWFSFNPADPEWTMMGNTCIGAYVALGDGDYTLKVQAGTYLFDGVENEAFEIKFTVGEGTQGGGEGGEFTGEKWQEVLFEAGVTSVSIPYTAETEGLSIKTEGREFMGMTLDVAYNTYGEKELDWNNGTKLIITAKDNISGIVFEGQYIGYASADKGTYNNGAWTGALMAGETLTLTANDGILVKKITVLYNGDEIKTNYEEDQDGKITVAWPVQNQVIASIAQGGTLAKFTTNKDYAIVTIELKNDNSFYSSHDLQVRMYDGQIIGEGVAKDIEHVVTTAVPDEKSFKLFKGDSYTLILKGFINHWDVPDNYDAITEIKIIGDGIDHEPLSTVKLVNMTPAGTPLEPGKLLKNGGKVTLTFDGPVTSVTGVNARGMEGSTTYKGTKADEDGKVWEIAFGDLSSLASAETEYIVFNLNITAKAADGTVVFDETKSDYRLEAAWILVDEEPTPDPVIDVTISPSFISGEEEIALNDHSAVSVATADAIKTTFGETPAVVKFATYSINELVEKEDFLGTYVDEEEVISGSFDLSNVGYSAFEEAIKFPAGHKYNVKIKAWDTTEILDANWNPVTPIATFECEFNGSYVEPEEGIMLVVKNNKGEIIYKVKADENIQIEWIDASELNPGDHK